MKMTLKLMGLCALIAFAAVACKKDQQAISSFKATLTQPTGAAKTHLGEGDSLYWNADDAIKVFDTAGNPYEFITTDANKTTATFTSSASLDATGSYTAFYPAANATLNSGNVMLTLAAEQNYTANSFANGTYPMVAVYDANNGFTFHSNCGLLAIPVRGSGNVSSIVLTDKGGKNLAGDLKYNLDGTYQALINAQTTMTLNCGNLALNPDAPTTFYFALPSGVFDQGFTVSIMNGTTELYRLETTYDNTIDAETITKMPAVLVSAIGVTTGAATNVGQTTATVSGSYDVPTGMSVTEVGFYFGTDASAMTATQATLETPFSHTFNGLQAGTTYYYKAYAKNGTNEYQGVVDSLTTPPVNHLIDLSTLTAPYDAQDGDTLMNALAGNYKITVADNATVTLLNATITYSSSSSSYAGITCLGDATLVLVGTNSVQPANNSWPAIHIAPSHTLTIREKEVAGALNATSTGDAAAIGAGNQGHACGNIVIESGTVTATSTNAAAIGGGQSTTGTCGDITISGGTVTATSSQCAGIGAGQAHASCGNIIISGGNVTATSNYSCAGIGAGMGYASCGTITISGNATVVDATSASGTGIGAGLSNSSCGAITISGGNVTARSNSDGVGIGSGTGSSNCGAITITDGVGSVTAIKGSGAQRCIGKSNATSSCGTITIGGTVYADGVNGNVDNLTYVYPFQAPALTTGNVTAIIAADDPCAATGHVTMTDAGTIPATEIGICWGTSSQPTVGSNNYAAATGTQLNNDYTVNMTGLASGTRYYVRGYAKVGNNYYYASNEKTVRTVFLIYNLSDWNAFAAVVNDGESTVHAFQKANISGVTTVVGNSESNPFKGTYNGQGYAISNVSISGGTHVGLFGVVNSASAVIENVVVASGSVSGTGQNVGAVVGTVNSGTVRYCANYAHVSSSYNGNARLGGIVGWLRSAGGTNNHLEYCINYGAVNGQSYVGGIVGSHGDGYVQYCQNYATITGTGTTAAGIMGWSTAAVNNYTHNHNGGNIVAGTGSTNATKRYFISNQSGSANLDSSNTFLNTLTVTLGGNVYTYTSSQISGYVKGATPVSSNPAGINICGTTYGPTTPAP